VIAQRSFGVAGTKSYQAKPGELTPQWFVVDATDKVVGRLASDIAMVLMGKHKPTYTPHVDTGDYVIVLNCDKVKFTGKKWEQKEYAWFTGYTRQRIATAGERREDHPDRILRDAVRRMLPKNDSLARKMLAKLKLYAGGEHDHQAQQPQPKELGVS
jgi:large subunit ribosomal protein L13